MPLLPKLVTHQESKPYVNSEMTGYESTTSRIVLSLIFQEHNSLGRRPHDQSKKKKRQEKMELTRKHFESRLDLPITATKMGISECIEWIFRFTSSI
jgi:hypothetical protein